MTRNNRTSSHREEQFTDLAIVHYGKSYVIAKAKRYGRWWALKALKEELRGDDSHTELLREEFKRLMAIQHSGIVTAVGFEQVEGLGHCIVMEWIEGQTLTSWLREKHTRSERLRMMRQIFAIYEYACREKGAMLDLSPSDVMVMCDGRNVKIIGFGQDAGEKCGFAHIIRDMNLGWTYAHVIRKCTSMMERGDNNVGDVRHALGRVALFHRVAVCLSLIAAFCCLLFPCWNEIATNRRAIASLENRQDSLTEEMAGIVRLRQDLESFVEGAKQYMRSQATYDLDTLTTFTACTDARMRLLDEMQSALADYWALHQPPVSYAYTHARFNLMDYRRDILRPLEEKCQSLRKAEGRDHWGRK